MEHYNRRSNKANNHFQRGRNSHYNNQDRSARAQFTAHESNSRSKDSRSTRNYNNAANYNESYDNWGQRRGGNNYFVPKSPNKTAFNDQENNHAFKKAHINQEKSQSGSQTVKTGQSATTTQTTNIKKTIYLNGSSKETPVQPKKVVGNLNPNKPQGMKECDLPYLKFQVIRGLNPKTEQTAPTLKKSNESPKKHAKKVEIHKQKATSQRSEVKSPLSSLTAPHTPETNTLADTDISDQDNYFKGKEAIIIHHETKEEDAESKKEVEEGKMVEEKLPEAGESRKNFKKFDTVNLSEDDLSIQGDKEEGSLSPWREEQSAGATIQEASNGSLKEEQSPLNKNIEMEHENDSQVGKSKHSEENGASVLNKRAYEPEESTKENQALINDRDEEIKLSSSVMKKVKLEKVQAESKLPDLHKSKDVEQPKRSAVMSKTNLKVVQKEAEKIQKSLGNLQALVSQMESELSPEQKKVIEETQEFNKKLSFNERLSKVTNFFRNFKK